MRYVDSRTVSAFGYVFGLISLLIGLYGYLYYETDIIGWIGLSFYPYRNYAIPLTIAGIMLMILGYFTEQTTRKKTKESSKQQSITNTSACPDCGTKREVDAEYCKKCGRKLNWIDWT